MQGLFPSLLPGAEITLERRPVGDHSMRRAHVGMISALRGQIKQRGWYLRMPWRGGGSVFASGTWCAGMTMTVFSWSSRLRARAFVVRFGLWVLGAGIVGTATAAAIGGLGRAVAIAVPVLAVIVAIGIWIGKRANGQRNPAGRAVADQLIGIPEISVDRGGGSAAVRGGRGHLQQVPALGNRVRPGRPLAAGVRSACGSWADPSGPVLVLRPVVLQLRLVRRRAELDRRPHVRLTPGAREQRRRRRLLLRLQRRLLRRRRRRRRRRLLVTIGSRRRSPTPELPVACDQPHNTSSEPARGGSSSLPPATGEDPCLPVLGGRAYRADNLRARALRPVRRRMSLGGPTCRWSGRSGNYFSARPILLGEALRQPNHKRSHPASSTPSTRRHERQR